MTTIDCTPTWEGLLPALLDLLEQKKLDPEKRKELREEFRKRSCYIGPFHSMTFHSNDPGIV